MSTTSCLLYTSYHLTGELKVERGRDGTAEAPITMTTADGKYATLDFGLSLIHI